MNAMKTDEQQIRELVSTWHAATRAKLRFKVDV